MKKVLLILILTVSITAVSSEMLPVQGYQNRVFAGHQDNYLAMAHKKFKVKQVSGPDPISGKLTSAFDLSHSDVRWGTDAIESNPVVIELDFNTTVHYWRALGMNFTYGRSPKYVKIEGYNVRGGANEWVDIYEKKQLSSREDVMHKFSINYISKFKITMYGVNYANQIAVETIWGYTGHKIAQGAFVRKSGDTIYGNMNIEGTVNIKKNLQVGEDGKRNILKIKSTGDKNAIGDIMIDSNGVNPAGVKFWNWSFRKDNWSGYTGDYVLYSHNGSSYTSPIIAQADGDLALVTGKGAKRDGKVGIGTTNPSGGRLHVKQKNSSAGNGIRIENKTNSRNMQLWVGTGGAVIDAYSNANLHLRTNGRDRMFIDNSTGDIGIGTTDPKYKLSVEGIVAAREIIVTQENWADFVFEDDYKLRLLEEVEKFVKKNRHLPDMPSEEEVKKNGVNVNDMQVKLLQKIEELTLYTIEQEKEIKRLKIENKEIKKVKKENEKIKKDIEKIKNYLKIK